MTTPEMFKPVIRVTLVEITETGPSRFTDRITRIQVSDMVSDRETTQLQLFCSDSDPLTPSEKKHAEEAGFSIRQATRSGMLAMLEQEIAGSDFVLFWNEPSLIRRLKAYNPAWPAGNWIDLRLMFQITHPQRESAHPSDLWSLVHHTLHQPGKAPQVNRLTDLLRFYNNAIGTDQHLATLATLMKPLEESSGLFRFFASVLAGLDQFQAIRGDQAGLMSVQLTSLDAYLRNLLRMKPGADQRMPAMSMAPVNEALVVDYFQTGLPAKTSGKFRARPQQIQYAGSVVSAINQGDPLLIEAGTGTGKSLGYLIPAMEFLRLNPGQRIIVSTALKNLQHQIFWKEIRSLKKWFPEAFRSIETAILKGRQNYCCLGSVRRRLRLLTEEGIGRHNEADYFVLVYLIHLTAYRDYVDLESIPEALYQMIPGLSDIIEMVRSDVSCFKSTCEYFGHCVYDQVLKEAGRSQLVIINHAKFFNMPDFLLETCRTVIVDEADLFPGFLRSSMSTEVGARDCWRLLSLARGSRHQPGWHTGLSVNGHPNAGFDLATLFHQVEEGIHQVNRWFSVHMKGKSTAYLPDFPEIESSYSLTAWIKPLLEPLQDIRGLISEWKEAGTLSLRPSVNPTFLVFMNRLDQVISGLSEFSRDYPSSAWCHYLLLREKDWYLGKKAVYIGNQFSGHMFDQVPSWVFTSATLTLDQSFDFFCNELGIRSVPVVTNVIESPFHYQEQAAIGVTTWIQSFRAGDPSLKNQWISQVSATCGYLSAVTNGRTLILCTSYEQMEAIYQAIADPLEQTGILVIRQEGASVDQIRQFTNLEQSVLIGVDRLWTGVDFPGSTCSQVIIVKLPFSPVDDPEIRHRQAVEGAGFWNWYHGIARLKFRQGAGRLIRSDTDKGLITVLDSRILAGKNREFLSTLPDMPVYSFRTLTETADFAIRKIGLQSEWQQRQDGIEGVLGDFRRL